MDRYFVYIMNSPTGTLYTGMTNDLHRRVYQHKHKLIEGFTSKYNVTRLAYFEESTDVKAAIAREKEIKGWRRSKKIALIKSINPKWQDLAEGWYDEDKSD
ncbi:MAG TPA: GIY-YIG nuclease family protein [Anaerolineales bacterium]|nr:GIY-YIG nuclease family protein [Anaerolineales bacterium]